MVSPKNITNMPFRYLISNYFFYRIFHGYQYEIRVFLCFKFEIYARFDEKEKINIDFSINNLDLNLLR